MSKKFKDQSHGSDKSQMHTLEYKIIRHDLLKVIVLNFLYLTGLLALYYTNLQKHYLETWFSRIFKF